MKVLVHNTAGEDAITVDDGQSVHQIIKPELLAGREVELDFDGVTVFASPFLNAAIGQLLKDLKPDDLNRLLQLRNLNATGRDMLRRVIENAKRYYASPNYREAQVKALERLSEGGS